jgi:hypothetical protein
MPVTLLYYTPDVPSAATRAERELLEQIAAGDPDISLRVLADRWDAADGYEQETFLAVLRAVAGGRSGLLPSTQARLRALSAPLHLEVLHAPT